MQNVTGSSAVAVRLARHRVHVGLPVVAIIVWVARSTPWALTAGAAIACGGLIVRALAAGQLRKHEALVTSGVYACTRNPLYLGSAVMAAGFALASDSLVAACVLVAYFALFYLPAIRWEEERLSARYGREFAGYSLRVPRIWPRFPRRSPFSGFSWRSWRWYWRNGEYAAAIGFVVGILTLVGKMLLRGPAAG
jgi:protein-S-isoprenylcysteine O-methyltransferase Ste14